MITRGANTKRQDTLRRDGPAMLIRSCIVGNGMRDLILIISITTGGNMPQ